MGILKIFFTFYRLSIVLLLYVLVNMVNTSIAKVIPPNYDFSLNSLTIFTPGAAISEIEKKYGKGIILEDTGPRKTLKFSVIQLRYKFPVFVQTVDGKVVDFYARLPSYFLHNIFHQSLIKKLGPQNRYLKKEEQAIYIWNNIKGNKHIYAGGCTITCFPIFYSVISNQSPSKALMDKLKEKENF